MKQQEIDILAVVALLCLLLLGFYFSMLYYADLLEVLEADLFKGE